MICATFRLACASGDERALGVAVGEGLVVVRFGRDRLLLQRLLAYELRLRRLQQRLMLVDGGLRQIHLRLVLVGLDEEQILVLGHIRAVLEGDLAQEAGNAGDEDHALGGEGLAGEIDAWLDGLHHRGRDRDRGRRRRRERGFLIAPGKERRKGEKDQWRGTGGDARQCGHVPAIPIARSWIMADATCLIKAQPKR